jgi:hypothetical protein
MTACSCRSVWLVSGLLIPLAIAVFALVVLSPATCSL